MNLPVLWIHGFPLSSEIWAPQLQIHGARHIAPDLRGFGSAEPPSGRLTMNDYADDLFAHLDTLGIERAVVAGLSMGGYVALAMARKNLQRIARLILVDTREVADSAQAREKRFDMIRAVQRDGVEPVVREMLPKLLSANAAPEMVRQVETIIRSSSTAGILAAITAMANRPDSSELLSELDIPSLVIVGSEDKITPVADAKRIAAKLPDAKLEIIQGAGHLSNFEKPAEFNRLIASFLAT